MTYHLAINISLKQRLNEWNKLDDFIIYKPKIYKKKKESKGYLNDRQWLMKNSKNCEQKNIWTCIIFFFAARECKSIRKWKPYLSIEITIAITSKSSYWN